MPYRIDIFTPPDDAIEKLIQLGALDIEQAEDVLAAIIPDNVTKEEVTGAFGASGVTLSAAAGRDENSVWLLKPRAVRIGNAELRLIDSAAFGTGHHPTTALCIEALEEAVSIAAPERVLDVGTGSGVLALAALIMGVRGAVGIDIDADALKVADENARLNNLSDRLDLKLGGPDVVAGLWPLVIANILAAPLIELAPTLVRRVGHRGRLILSGIPQSLESEVVQTYIRLGMHHLRSESRRGWTAVVLNASW